MSRSYAAFPLLVLLFYIAFVGAPAAVALWNFVTQPLQSGGLLDPLQVRDFSLLWRAIIALMLAYAAFLAEIFRAGIQAVDKGQIEAAKALGLKRFQRFRLIVMPQAIRTILPPYGNDFISMVKDSSLVSVLGVVDVTQMGKVYASGSFRFFETYSVVAYIYLDSDNQPVARAALAGTPSEIAVNPGNSGALSPDYYFFRLFLDVSGPRVHMSTK